jgi:pimeloyl-ACP methyl ester carboxylesterase
MQPPEDAPPDRREFAGVKLEVVTVPARRAPDGGSRRALFVLAPFGWTHDYFRPHLDLLGETFDVSYIRLPSVRDLTGQAGYGDAIPVYPVERLAKAFDALRKDRGVEKVVLLAEGAAAWIAETYALRQPSRTAGLILVNAWIDADSYRDALLRMAEAGNGDERAIARSLLGLDPSARDPAEDRWMARTALTHRLVDRDDLLGHHLWTRTRDAQGFASVPPLRLDRHARIEAPALFLFPAGSPLSGHPEAGRVRDAFPKSLVAALEDTRGLSWVDRHDEFHRVVRGFVDRFGLDR